VEADELREALRDVVDRQALVATGMAREVVERRARRFRRRRRLLLGLAPVGAAVAVAVALLVRGTSFDSKVRVTASSPRLSPTTVRVTPHDRVAAATLQAAAAATAHATSFIAYVEGVDVSYQAPDRFEQVEHGEGVTTSSKDNGTSGTSSAPYVETITKIFIGSRYYEADTVAGRSPSFSASARCSGQPNVVENILGILRALASSKDVRASGDQFAFSLSKGADVPLAITGTATVRSGFVERLTISPDLGHPSSVTIGSVNEGPPVTAPPSSTERSASCN